jgi:hypothetical protein
MMFLQESYEYKIPAIIIGFILPIIIWPLILVKFIKIAIDKNNKKRFAISLCVNMIFILSSSTFIISNKYINILLFQLGSYLVLIIILIIVYNTIHIEKEDDYSYLKGTNLILGSIFICMTMIVKMHKIIGNINTLFEEYLNYYFVLPLAFLQGIYELLDGKTR